MTSIDPLALTATYMSKQFSGLPGDYLFSALANPPATGVTAQNLSISDAQAVGTAATNARVVFYADRNQDRLKDFYDQASYYVISPAPVPAPIP